MGVKGRVRDLAYAMCAHIPKPAAEMVLRAGARAGDRPFVFPLSEADVDKLIAMLDEVEKLPTIRAGMEAMGMKSLLEWVWRKEQIASSGHAFSHPKLLPYLFFPGLTPRTIYTADSFPWVREFESNYAVIRDEVEAALHQRTGFQPYRTGENNQVADDWNMLQFLIGGQRVEENVKLCPNLMAAVEAVPDLARFGLVTLSALNPGATIFPHYGPMNGIVRAHFGVTGCNQACYLRVADDITQWTDGKLCLFDDSFEHHVSHRGEQTRIVLWFDLRHPDWPRDEFETFSAIMNKYFLDLDWWRTQNPLWDRDRHALDGETWWKSSGPK